MAGLSPRETGNYIARLSNNVKIRTEQVPVVAQTVLKRMREEGYSPSSWKKWPLHPKEPTKETVDWIFVVDCLNFSFWLPGDRQFQLEYNGRVHEDYEALCAAINRALQEGIPITTPSFYQHVTLEKIQHIFRSCNGCVLPLLEERTKNLNQAGRLLAGNYNDSFANLIAGCEKDVQVAIQTVTELFPSFQDVGIFEGMKVCFYKRVQILIADIWACFEGRGYGEFNNIQLLTMFPDYRVPQALLALNLITYSNELMDKLQNNTMLANGSRDEMEIRGCSIHVVELLRHELSKLLDDEPTIMNSIVIDFYLWDFATMSNDVKNFPEHKTRCIYY